MQFFNFVCIVIIFIHFHWLEYCKTEWGLYLCFYDEVAFNKEEYIINLNFIFVSFLTFPSFQIPPILTEFLFKMKRREWEGTEKIFLGVSSPWNTNSCIAFKRRLLVCTNCNHGSWYPLVHINTDFLKPQTVV